jgi:hypothetical protein
MAIIKIRRGTTTQWNASSRVLQVGELGLDTTLNRIKAGNGIGVWSALPYLSLSSAEIEELSQDSVAAALAAGTHSNITVTYSDSGNSISLATGPDVITQTSLSNTLTNATTGYVPIADVGSADGVASLDSGGKVPDSEIPSGIARLASPTFTGTVTLPGDPSSSLQAATKQYVDNTASGVVAKPQVLGATTANIDATYSNGTAGVGATLTHNTNGVFPSGAGGASGWAVGKGILVKNQTNKAENGRYYVSDMGSPSTPYVLTRCGYCDEASEIPGAYIFVQAGTSAGTGWVQVVADPTTFVVGTDNIDVYQFSGSGTYTAGTGLTLNGTQYSIDTTITQARVADVSDTEIGYLNGVTSAIQTQLNAKAVYPTQSSNSGKYLTTDGSTPSWATIPVTSPATHTTVGTLYGKMSDETDPNAVYTALGYNALANRTSGGYIVAVGHKALYNAISSADSVAIGSYALFTTTTGYQNVAVGPSALTLSTGYGNVALGHISGRDLTSGNYNTFLGWGTGYNDGSAWSGSNNILIGQGVMPTTTSTSNEIRIGNASNNVFRIPGLAVNWTTSAYGRATYASTSAPSGGADGDVWLVYTA